MDEQLYKKYKQFGEKISNHTILFKCVYFIVYIYEGMPIFKRIKN